MFELILEKSKRTCSINFYAYKHKPKLAKSFLIHIFKMLQVNATGKVIATLFTSLYYPIERINDQKQRGAKKLILKYQARKDKQSSKTQMLMKRMRLMAQIIQIDPRLYMSED
jgi:hypothetical protein